MIDARLRNRTRPKGWSAPSAPSIAQTLDELLAEPGLWDNGERTFHADLFNLPTSTLRGERARARFRLMIARDGDRLPWWTARLTAVESELKRRRVST